MLLLQMGNRDWAGQATFSDANSNGVWSEGLGSQLHGEAEANLLSDHHSSTARCLTQDKALLRKQHLVNEKVKKANG